MFATIGRTWDLFKMSWRVLMKDKELLWFPIMSFLAVAVIAGAFLAIAFATGSFDRLQAAFDNSNTAAANAEERVNAFDIALYVVGFVLVTFVTIFFNAALIAAAMERLRGGDPTVRSGLKATIPHIGNICGWAIIAASVGLILQAARSNTNNFLGRIALAIVGGVWAYMTFFVVPVLVAKGYSPIQAIKESGSLFKRTWGEQVTSNIGFGVFQFIAIFAAIIPALIVFSINPIAGFVVGVPLVVLALGVVGAVSGIFRAALYQYAAEGVIPQGFENAQLGDSFSPDGRGSAGMPRGFV